MAHEHCHCDFTANIVACFLFFAIIFDGCLCAVTQILDMVKDYIWLHSAHELGNPSALSSLVFLFVLFAHPTLLLVWKAKESGLLCAVWSLLMGAHKASVAELPDVNICPLAVYRLAYHIIWCTKSQGFVSNLQLGGREGEINAVSHMSRQGLKNLLEMGGGGGGDGEKWGRAGKKGRERTSMALAHRSVWQRNDSFTHKLVILHHAQTAPLITALFSSSSSYFPQKELAFKTPGHIQQYGVRRTPSISIQQARYWICSLFYFLKRNLFQMLHFRLGVLYPKPVLL